MISDNEARFTLQNVGKIYKLNCIDFNLGELLELFQNIPNFRVISIKLNAVFYKEKRIDNDVTFESKGVYDCLQELSYDIPADELDVVGFEVLWYDEVIEPIERNYELR